MTYDAVVAGSGPNGLAAAITLAQAGRAVVVLEAAETVGGGTRSAPLIPAADHGLRWIQPELALAHPLDGRPAAALHRSVAETAAQFGSGGRRYRRLLGPLVAPHDPARHADP